MHKLRVQKTFLLMEDSLCLARQLSWLSFSLKKSHNFYFIFLPNFSSPEENFCARAKLALRKICEKLFSHENISRLVTSFFHSVASTKTKLLSHLSTSKSALEENFPQTSQINFSFSFFTQKSFSFFFLHSQSRKLINTTRKVCPCSYSTTTKFTCFNFPPFPSKTD